MHRRRRSAVLSSTPSSTSPTSLRRAHHMKGVPPTSATNTQRYSLSAIVIPKLSISDDGDSSDGITAGNHK